MTLDDIETVEQIKLQCTEEGDCWIWDGDRKNGRTPTIYLGGKLCSVRRVVAEATGLELGRKLLATNTCNDQRCVAPHHIVAMTQKGLQKRSAEVLKHQSSMSRLIKLRNTKRATLNMQTARAIRAQEGLKTNRALAKEYGVCETQIGRIMKHKVWRELENPFMQLIAAANSTNWSQRS